MNQQRAGEIWLTEGRRQWGGKAREKLEGGSADSCQRLEELGGSAWTGEEHSGKSSLALASPRWPVSHTPPSASHSPGSQLRPCRSCWQQSLPVVETARGLRTSYPRYPNLPPAIKPLKTWPIYKSRRAGKHIFKVRGSSQDKGFCLPAPWKPIV